MGDRRYISTAILLYLGRFLRYLDLFTQSVGLLGRGMSPSRGRYPHTEQQKHRICKCIQTSMPRAELELTVPVFERVKTVHALDRAATLFGGVEVY
jgi:hypothetical protein